MPNIVHADGKSHSRPWWRSAVIYQIYIRSFNDSNDDGIGDIAGITARIPYLSNLGIDAIWLTPFYPSPQADNGYDISQYRDVDPQYGTLKDFDELIRRAHKFNIKVIIDIVANHTSAQHPWFKTALKSPPGSRKRSRYHFRDGKGAHFDEPPNNWHSWFGGSAWTRVPNDRQWYLHTFSDQQPDLNWHNPEVRLEFEHILRFWIGHGVDGFRVDAAMCFMKRADFSDMHPTDLDDPLSHQPGVFEIFREWRKVIDEYPQRCLIGEVFGDTVHQTLQYIKEGCLHQTFNFDYQSSTWQMPEMYYAIVAWLRDTAALGSEPIWVTSSHDQVRHVSRLGLTMPGLSPRGLDASSEQPSPELGQRRARAMICLTAFLPGAICLYYGEEVGLPEHTTLSDKFRRDPRFKPGEYIGRDGARIPMPWKHLKPSFGFSNRTRIWLPQPSNYRDYAIDKQSQTPNSMLQLYREVLKLRHRFRLGTAKLRAIKSPRGDIMMFQSGDLFMAINFGHMPATLSVSGKVIIASHPDVTYADRVLPGNSAIWLKMKK